MSVSRSMLVAALAFASATARAQPLGADNYAVDTPLMRPAGARLVWADEFDGNRLDPAKWSYDASRNKAGWYNGERQYYGAGAGTVQVRGGHLRIVARKERRSSAPDWGGQDYSSGRIMTRGKAAWTYGFYEVRAKLPCARGTWPAIWMLPETGGWPEGGEIDIMEQVGSDPNVVHATLHTALFNHARHTQRGAARTVPTSCSAFHLYQLDWRPDSITIGIDGRGFMRVRNDQPGGRGAWPFDAPFHMILNLAVGGAWAGSKGIDDAALPQAMDVDYVRVWQRPTKGQPSRSSGG